MTVHFRRDEFKSPATNLTNVGIQQNEIRKNLHILSSLNHLFKCTEIVRETAVFMQLSCTNISIKIMLIFNVILRHYHL